MLLTATCQYQCTDQRQPPEFRYVALTARNDYPSATKKPVVSNGLFAQAFFRFLLGTAFAFATFALSVFFSVTFLVAAAAALSVFVAATATFRVFGVAFFVTATTSFSFFAFVATAATFSVLIAFVATTATFGVLVALIATAGAFACTQHVSATQAGHAKRRCAGISTRHSSDGKRASQCCTNRDCNRFCYLLVRHFDLLPLILMPEPGI